MSTSTDCLQVKSLKVVDWKSIRNMMPEVGLHGEEPNTIYLDKQLRVRWRYEDSFSETGKAIKRRVKGWDGRFWGIPSESAKLRLEQVAIGAGWRVAEARELEAPQLIPLEAIQCGPDAWFLAASVAKWRELASQRGGGRLAYALGRLALGTNYTWVHDPSDSDRLMMAPTTRRELDALLERLNTRSCRIDCSRRSSDPEIRLWSEMPVHVVEGEIVRATLNLGNPLHLALLEADIGLNKRGAEVSPHLSFPLADWQKLANRFRAMGGRIETRQNAVRFEKPFDLTKTPGWEAPAPNGLSLFAHQKAGIEFLVANGMRAIVGDEMGIGKTAQAICAAHATRAKRILTIVPANARFVWEREIRGWAGDAVSVVHVDEALSEVDLPEAGWVIVTYDLLAARVETWNCDTPIEAEALAELLRDGTSRGGRADPRRTVADADSKRRIPSTLRFDPRQTPEIGDVLKRIDVICRDRPETVDRARAEHLRRLGRRLSGEMLSRLSDWDPDIVFVDEAHRIKNASAARTQVVRSMLADPSRGAILLSGTPLRNNSREGAELVEAVFPGLVASHARRRANGHRFMIAEGRSEAVAELLQKVMIWRLKTDVLDLPPKIRHCVDIEPTGEHLEDYDETLGAARSSVREAIDLGKTLSEARKTALDLLATAKRLLGLAKIADGEIADLIDAIVDEKKACLVFAAHHAVSDALAKQLRQKGRSVVVVDGRTSQRDRAESVRKFQMKEVDVFLGGVNTAGEAITLTRADTCVFVELDWVPAAMLQAEDRGHRAGQDASGYLIITCVARTPGIVSLDEEIASVLEEKLNDIDATLGEGATLIGRRGHVPGIQSRIINKLLDESDLEKAASNARKLELHAVDDVDADAEIAVGDGPLPTRTKAARRRRIR